MKFLARTWTNLRARYLSWYWSLGAKEIQPPPVSPPGVKINVGFYGPAQHTLARLELPAKKVVSSVAVDRMFSPVDWITEALKHASNHSDPERELQLMLKLQEWKRRRAPRPWRTWRGSGPRHASKRRFVEYSPGMFRRVA